ncbi:MAG: HEAT repeat domain-containing protein [Planctomycetes bacterium]|nr:HEAT repeat domain-containing protein [Planctomycetota bacterium]MBI3834068.1 HEAT repeat domain-containing protein [Planctomycetota bacterium]
MNAAPIPVALRLLVEEKNLAADAAIIEALPSMNASAQGAALDVLVKRAQPAALAAVVAGFSSFDAPLRQKIAERLKALHHGVRMAIASSGLETRLAAIEAIRESQDAGCAYLLSDAIKGRCPKTREMAALTLHEMTARHVDRISAGVRNPAPNSHGTATNEASTADSLAEALSKAIQSWELHFQPLALEASLWLGDRTEAALTKKLSESHTKIVHAINDLFATKIDWRLAGAMLRALAHPAIRSSASKALARANDPALLAAICEDAWLLCDAEIVHSCRWIQDARSSQEWCTILARLPEAHAARAVRFIDAAGGSPQRRIDVLRAVLDAERPAVRREVLWRLCEEQSEAADSVLRCVAGRMGDDLAELALRELNRRALRANAPSASMMVPPTTIGAESQTAAVHAKSHQAVEDDHNGSQAPPDEIEYLFLQYETLSLDERRRGGAALRGSTPNLIDRLRDKIRSSQSMDRVKALQIASFAGVERELDVEIFAAVHDREAAVRSAAVTLLAAIGGATANRLVRAALNDPDGRVQANAVEVVDKLGTPNQASVLAEKLESPHSRVRANAVKALLRTDLRTAGGALLGMLKHPEQTHRLSALWVVERLDLRSVFGCIEELSVADPNPRVRMRASRVMRRILSAPVANSIQSRSAATRQSESSVEKRT